MMRVYRGDKNSCGGWGVEIRLTPQELADAYYEHQYEEYAQEIAQNISVRIRDALMDNHYAPDWPMRVGKTCAERLREALEANAVLRRVFQETVNEVVDQQLEELGINKETMKMRKDFN